MSFEKITRTYLRDFQKSVVVAHSSGAKSIELATRPVVHYFVQALAEHCKKIGSSIVVHHDTNYTNKDRPDWRFEDGTNFGVFCFGDHKSISLTTPFQPTPAEQKQITRYLDIGRPVFVFDGIEFIFYQGNLTSAIRCQIVPKPLNISDDWADLVIDSSAENHFRNILENPGFRKWTETQLVKQLANRARIVADEMANLLAAPQGSGNSDSEEKLLCSLHELRAEIAEHHDPSLRDDQACSDFITQVLTFGLFYAHTRHTKSLTSPEDRQLAIKSFWTSANFQQEPQLLRPFKTIVQALSTSLDSKNILSEWYQEIMGVLAHAEYMGTEPGPQDFHALFEQFLTTFDEQARFDRGAFYTPRVLTDWVAKAANQVSVECFGEPIMEAADKIIDPCCGTGGFLEAVYLLNFNCNAINQAVLIGFEILPAPYALAHYRLAELFDGDPNPPLLKILLTDTLADQMLKPPSAAISGFSEELNDAIKHSKPPLRLVIGNPPSSNHPTSSAERKTIEKLLDDFRPPKRERTDRQNIQKALNNEAYRFLRWCGGKAIESGRGILALVLPGAFARAVSFQYARTWLLNNFQNIYILEVDGDARKNDATQSIFSVLQGRLVLIATKDNIESDHLSKIYHLDISDKSLPEKITFLNSDVKLSSFVPISPSTPQWRLAPSATYPIDLWQKGWPLTSTRLNQGIFLSKCSGVKLAPTAMLFHTQKPTLIRRSSDLGPKSAKTHIEPTVLIERWFAGQKRPPAVSKLTPAVKVALKGAATANLTSPYLFRPFVHGTVLNSDKLFTALSHTSGGGVRARPEVRSAFQAGAIGIAVAPAPSDLGATLTRFACFSWSLPDNDIAARGNAMIYCDLFPERGAEDTTILIENIDSNIKALFNFNSSPLKATIFYVYAVLSCPAYLETFEGVLYSSSDPSAPPRIPISTDIEIRQQIANLGQKIADCERPDYVAQTLPLLSINWSQSVVEFKLIRSVYDETSEQLILTGDQSESLRFTNVPSYVIALRIAGHNVVEKWLRERQFPYLRRSFTNVDAEALKQLICRICEQVSLIEVADVLVSSIITSEKLIEPTAAM